jgi:hypothetical protein
VEARVYHDDFSDALHVVYKKKGFGVQGSGFNG